MAAVARNQPKLYANLGKLKGAFLDVIEACEGKPSINDFMCDLARNLHRDWKSRNSAIIAVEDITLLAPHEIALRRKLPGLSNAQRQQLEEGLLDIPIADLHRAVLEISQTNAVNAVAVNTQSSQAGFVEAACDATGESPPHSR
jgi:hypothetical protein